MSANGLVVVPKLRILSLGWGVQSWTLAAMMALGEMEPVDFAVFADTGWEHSATYAHATKWTPWLEQRGVKVRVVKGKRTDVVREDWSAATMIPAFSADRVTGAPGQIRRQCTHDWKIMPVRAFIRGVLKERGLAAAQGVLNCSWASVWMSGTGCGRVTFDISEIATPWWTGASPGLIVCGGWGSTAWRSPRSPPAYSARTKLGKHGET